MVEKQLQAYRTYQRFFRIFLIICCCWYMPTKSGKSTYYRSICGLLLGITYLLLLLSVSYNCRHNLIIMMKYIGIATSAVSAILKVTRFMINRDSLINLHRTLNDFFEEELTKGEKIRTVIFSPLRKMYILGYTYVTIMIALILGYFIPPYMHIIRDFCHLRFTTNYTLPITKGYGYFWTIPHNFLYHLHLLTETILGSFSSLTASGVDSAFIFYVFQFSSTLRAMTFRLTNSQPTERFSDVLKTCIKKHVKLLRCRNTLEHIYGPIIFWHIITNAVLLCSLLYDASQLSSFKFSSLVEFLTFAIVKLLQMFIYAWCGTILTNAGNDFRNGIYFGEWPNSALDRDVRTNVVLMMMQKPMTISAVFSTVEVVLFTNFVNTTMSYFFLLKSISE